MNLNIVNQEDVHLLSRKQISLEVTFNDKTPSREEIKKSISSLMKVKDDVVKIKKIHQVFGTKTASVSVYIYNNAESLKLYEPKKKDSKGQKESSKEEKKEVKEEKKEEANKDGKEEKTKEQSAQ